MSDDLKPLAPREAYDLWIKRQQSEKSESTIQSYRYRVAPFVEWCEDRGIENLNDLDGRDLLRFDSTVRDKDVQKNTLNNQLGTLKLFLSFCADADAVSDDLPGAVDVPKLSKDDRINREKFPSERAKKLIENLETFRYASLDHVIVLLAWRTGARLGSLRGLDVRDVFLEESDLDRFRYQEDLDVENSMLDEILEGVDVPFIYFRHREGTPLKKKASGERPVNITDEVGDILGAYLNVNRPEITDEYGRKPFLASEKGGGRISKSGLRNRLYRLTQPCRFGGDCPHDRVVEECEAREHGYESRCPSSRSPHRLRTGSITWHRDRGWPPEAIAEKMATSVELVNSVYDQPEKLKRMASRRNYLDNLE